ncbi:sigma-54-dependent Fis family transcriptional regulator [Burkholderia sp. Ac-20379]|uniref:sigma-54-dependent Fis family transcriptional regulator n=1 Tax=Burkholderia sp. Ac-20379 TaxID=2703900 RepID=UPI001981CEF6|nr:sigma-54-dependent Fis family transcriptional regulator [Burkholderia sp. Ac-20379]MBN3725354.1 sigma-54-dependent Fis family transcriptional regulator [Burkholderia sp. Ac-20379]
MSIDDHLENIMSALTAESEGAAPAMGSGTAPDWTPYSSWRRCMDKYRIQPDAKLSVPVLTASELTEARSAFGDDDLTLVMPELQRLLSIIGPVGYNATLADSRGVILVEIAPDDPAYHCISDKEGTYWHEEYGGTNGIGSTLIEQRATSVFKQDHYFSELIAQSCVAAPLRNIDGHIKGVINLATCNSDITESAHRVIYQLALDSAVKLEAKLFRAQFADDAVLQFHRRTGPAVMLAIGDDFQVTGATRSARDLFGFADLGAAYPNLWSVFDRSDEAALMNSGDLRAIGLRLLSTGRLHKVSVWPGARQRLRTQAVALESVRGERGALRAGRSQTVTIAECAGADRRMQANVTILNKLKDSGIPMLLLGETGTGKDTLAKAIHQDSGRANGPFVAFNCAAVPESLIDSELFGYAKGAFTGANREGNQGRFVEAHGGTIFLDEIGDMPLPLQTRLLRVLESGEVTPLGSGRPRQVDLQVIAATHQNLRDKVAAGLFREDLYYRLAGVVIDVPSLRDRDDVAGIAQALLARLSEGKAIKFDDGAMAAILAHRWPGNIRELRFVLQRAIKLSEGGVVSAADLLLAPPLAGSPRPALAPLATPPMATPASVVAPPAATAADAAADPASDDHTVRSALASAERAAIIKALTRHANNIDAAAQSLSMSRATIYRKLKRYDIRM